MQTLKMLLPFVFIFVFFNGRSQNLVPNCSFEVYDTCPNNEAQITYALPWYQATYGGTPDYYNACSNPFNVPWTGIGYQFAVNGIAFAGEYAFVFGYKNTREYIQSELLDSLKQNHFYHVSFFVNLCDDCDLSVNKMGAYLSDSAIYSNDTSYLQFIPQIESSTFLSDTANWMQISGYYQAHGGEKYITIGNFRSDTLTDTLHVNNFGWSFAYYYIDSVTVIDCTATGINETTINSLLQLAPNPASHYFTVKVQQKLVLEKVSVFSLVGEQVMEQNASGNASELTVSVATLPKGIYLVKVKTNRGVGYKKIVIL